MMEIKRFEFNVFGVNTYVVWDSDTLDAAVVDPGMPNSEECSRLSKFITDNSLKVTALLNTHLHIDHLLGDEYVESRYGVDLQASSKDSFLSDRLQNQVAMFHLRVNIPERLEIAVPLKAGNKVRIGKSYLDVIEVPGHSPGSLAFYSPADGFVITGDALFRGSVGRTDLPGGSYPTLIKSITDNLLTLPPSTVVYPGHGPASTIGDEISMNPFL